MGLVELVVVWGVSPCGFNLGLFDREGVIVCIFHIFVQIRTL